MINNRMKLLCSAKNGNYRILFFDDGTKIRILDDGETVAKPIFPESIDLEISKKCSMGCPFCYAQCTKDSPVSTKKDLEELDMFLYHTLYKAAPNRVVPTRNRMPIELAIGGGALSEIDLEYFSALLESLYNYGFRSYPGIVFIPNITVNAKELLKNDFLDFIIEAVISGRINGIGVSYVSNPSIMLKAVELNKYLNKNCSKNNLIIHTIYGITTIDDYKWLSNAGFKKILVLGYKDFGRGKFYKKDCPEEIQKNMKDFDDNFDKLSDMFDITTFDCLAVEQINIKNRVPKDIWEKFYMGDDGKFTFYIDWLAKKYCKNSITPENERLDIADGETIKELFEKIRN